MVPPMPIDNTAAARPGRSRLVLVLVCALGGLAPVACGGDGESPEGVSEAGRPAGETVSQPPLEAAPDGTATSGSDVAGEQAEDGGDVVVDTDMDPEPCPDVVITPDSGNGLFAVEAEGITCEDAVAALEAWGRSGYPGEGPQGFACAPVEEGDAERSRLRCEQHPSGGVVEFETGN